MKAYCLCDNLEQHPASECKISMSTGRTEMVEPTMEELEAALDEIYFLRRALAYEALVVKAHGSYKTFPKSRRPVLEDQVERMQAAARGEVARAYEDVSDRFRLSLLEAGAKETFTRWQFRREQAIE